MPNTVGTKNRLDHLHVFFQTWLIKKQVVQVERHIDSLMLIKWKTNIFGNISKQVVWGLIGNKRTLKNETETCFVRF